MKTNIKILGIFLLCLCHLSVSAQEPDVDRDLDHPLEKIDSTKRTTFNAYPYVFYTPEMKIAFGAGGVFVFYTAKDSIVKPSKIGFGGHYTTNKQYKIVVNPVFYFAKNKIYFEAPTSYAYIVDKFWGVGNAVPDTGSVSFKMRNINTSFVLQIPPAWFSADRTGLIFEYDNTSIIDKQENQLLLNDEVSGSDGGQLFGFGTDLVWDSRDNIFFPNTGGYQYLNFMVYTGAGDYQYISLELDVRHYRAFRPDHVLAGQFFVKGVNGDTPFYKLPGVGGNSLLRGYYTGRYRDNTLMLLQLEYRQYFTKRFGFVVFAGTGNVTDKLQNYAFNNLKYSYGGGLRFMFNQQEKINLRMDLAFGNKGNMGIYFGIEEAF